MASKGISWDEATISEHDKLRGTRMKIDEPNTPYHNYEEPSVEELKHLALDTENVVAPKSPKEQNINDTMEDVSSKLNEYQDGQELKEDFKQKRKQHYNEFQKMKEFRDQNKV